MLASATLNSSLGSQIADGNRDRDLVAAALSLLTRIFVRIAPENSAGPAAPWLVSMYRLDSAVGDDPVLVFRLDVLG